ncbi:DUF7489 domain-containing protein [Actinosynnema sp. CA-299493]
MGMPVEVVVALVVAACVGFTVLALAGNRVTVTRARMFSGQVVERRHEKVVTGRSVHFDFWVIVLTDDDETISVGVTPEVFRGLAVGDRVAKEPGQHWPTRV